MQLFQLLRLQNAGSLRHGNDREAETRLVRKKDNRLVRREVHRYFGLSDCANFKAVTVQFTGRRTLEWERRIGTVSDPMPSPWN